MDIYVVLQGDNIYSIAEKYGITADKLIQDNGLEYPYNLVIGETLVITYPKQSHTVQQGDTLQSIADTYQVTPMQIMRNNPALSDGTLNPGDELTVSFDTIGSIKTNGFAYPYIREEVLKKTLPSLTYLSIFNYTITKEGAISSYEDDAEIIRTSKEYGVVPLILLTTFSLSGEPNLEIAQSLLTNIEYQERFINEFTDIMRNQGYTGANLIFNYVTEGNQSLYQSFLQRIYERIQPEGFLLYITINYNIQSTDSEISFEQVDYSKLSIYVNGITFLRFVWGTNYDPPSPVSNINDLTALINMVTSQIPEQEIIIGKQMIGYDWTLPYVPGKTIASSLTIRSVLELAYEAGAVIQFDEVSQTPFFYYDQLVLGNPVQHIVWFVDARSIEALNKLILEKGLSGSGIWNIMIYYQQLWTLINATFDIIKLI